MDLEADEFERLLRPVIVPAARFAYGMLHDHAEAEDAIQEAALKSWRHRSRLRCAADFRPWFLGIVANRCRTVRRGRWWTLIRLPEIERPSEEGAEAEFLRGADLRRALRRLPHGQQAAIVLHFTSTCLSKRWPRLSAFPSPGRRRESIAPYDGCVWLCVARKY